MSHLRFQEFYENVENQSNLQDRENENQFFQVESNQTQPNRFITPPMQPDMQQINQEILSQLPKLDKYEEKKEEEFMQIENQQKVKYHPIQDVLLCCICHQQFNLTNHIPRSLQCGHTICIQTAKKLYDNRESTVKCPLCKRKSFIKKENCSRYSLDFEEDKLKLPKNYALIGVLEQIRKGKLVQVNQNLGNPCYELIDEEIKLIENQNDFISKTFNQIQQHNNKLLMQLKTQKQKLEKEERFHFSQIDWNKIEVQKAQFQAKIIFLKNELSKIRNCIGTVDITENQISNQLQQKESMAKQIFSQINDYKKQSE